MAEGPLFLESEHSLVSPLSALAMHDLVEMYHATPDQLASAIEKANELENPELALFMTGILAARAIETPHFIPVYRDGMANEAMQLETPTVDSVRALLRVVPTLSKTSKP